MSNSGFNDRFLRGLMQLFSRLLVACLLMIWGAMNLATNVRLIRANGMGEDGLISFAALGTLGLIVVTCLLPIGIGVLILIRFDKGVAGTRVAGTGAVANKNSGSGSE